MTTNARELIVRASALYIPITVAAFLVFYRRPNRARMAGILVAVAWNLGGLLAANIVAQRVGWWSFSVGSATIAGVPADLWIGWVLLWGAVPLLAPSERLLLAGAGLFAVDLVLMPLANPVVSLRPSWIIGELLCVCLCLAPGLMLGDWTAKGAHLAQRASLQVIAFGGLLLFVVPTLIFTVSGDNWAPLLNRPRWELLIATALAAPAGAMALQAVREFAVIGHGTPVPLDPPTRLVISGPYAYVANPMQLGATAILAGWGILIGSVAVIAAAAMAALFSAGFAAWNEGIDLSERFGADWHEYRTGVRAWLPTWYPYVPSPASVFVSTTCEPCSEVGRFLANRRTNGLVITAAETSPEQLRRITYCSPGVHDSGLAALGRSLEHINLAWAIASWIFRLPLIRPFLQLIADATGAGPVWSPTNTLVLSPRLAMIVALSNADNDRLSTPTNDAKRVLTDCLDYGRVMKIGINATALVQRASVEAFVAHARAAEKDGFSSYWVAEHPTGGLDALTVLTIVGQQVERMELGTAVIPTYPRHPMVLAGQALTVQSVIRSRLTLGIGLSHKVMMGALGLADDKPIRHLRDYLSVLCPLLSSGRVSYEGPTISCTAEVFKPAATPPQVLVAALGPQALKVTGALADGTSLAWVGPKTIRTHIVPLLRDAAMAAGLTATPRVLATLPVCVTNDPTGVRERITKTSAMYAQLPSYQAMFEREGVQHPGELGIVGSEAEVEDALRVLAAAGVTDFAASEFTPSPDEKLRTRELLKRLAAE